MHRIIKNFFGSKEKPVPRGIELCDEDINVSAFSMRYFTEGCCCVADECVRPRGDECSLLFDEVTETQERPCYEHAKPDGLRTPGRKYVFSEPKKQNGQETT